MTNTEKLADELFRLVECEQGFSYISDGNGDLSREEILAIARISLDAHRSCASKLRRWIAEQKRAVSHLKSATMVYKKKGKR